MVCQIPVGKEGKFASRCRLVFCERHVRLEDALAQDLPVHVLRCPHVFAEDAKFGAGVFHRREIGVEQVGASDAVKGGSHHLLGGPYGVFLGLYAWEA